MLSKENQRSAYELREQRGLTWEKIGDTLGVSRHTAKRLYDQYIPIVNSYPIKRFEPIHVYGDAVISCDWHVPLHSPTMVNHLLEKASHHDMKQLVIAGDLFNMDTFSHFLPHQPEAKFELEREEATKLIDAALDVFDEVIISWGNHDFRLVRFLGFELGFEYLIRWVLAELGEEKLSRVVVTDLDYLLYHPGPVDIRLCHQKNFSKIPLTVPRQLAQKYHMSCLAAHSHHFAQGVALDGENLIFEGGGLFDRTRTEYVQRTTLHHQWVQGFYIWEDGVCHPYSPIYNNL